MSLVVRNPGFCICENKDADQNQQNNIRFYIGKKIQVTKDKSIEADQKTKTQLLLSRVVSKPFFRVYDQDVIEAAYALTATNKTL